MFVDNNADISKIVSTVLTSLVVCHLKWKILQIARSINREERVNSLKNKKMKKFITLLIAEEFDWNSAYFYFFAVY